MLHHHLSTPDNPARVVVLGARGFLGAATCRQLAALGIETLALGSSDLDLAADDAADRLSKQIRGDDSLVMFAALTPDRGRDIATMMTNLRMAEAVCNAIMRATPVHMVYVSSDAVYSFRSALVNETTPAEPGDLYGAMHRTRELMFAASAGKAPLAILRPTLIYGPGDTHNSYGPNRFRRMAAKDGRIVLGGAGEETRDHLFIEDAAELIVRVLRQRSAGLLNLASGRSTSFREVADLVAEQFDPPAAVDTTERRAPVTHRSFDVTALHKA
ncbi:MAG: NAD(P)-dependent oxidoreductase, partial [Alphaproteobacteria bacterium]